MTTFANALNAAIEANVSHYPIVDLSDSVVREMSRAICHEVRFVGLDDKTWEARFPDGSSVSFAYDEVDTL